MSSHFNNFSDNESGATAIEYAMLVSLLAVVLVGVLFNLGMRLSSEFVEINNTLK